MPQIKQSPSTTTLTSNGVQTDIYTYYQIANPLGHLVSAVIVQAPTSFNGASFIEGELALTYDHVNHTAHLDFMINPNGELVVLSYDSAVPASAYEIESLTGQLQITL